MAVKPETATARWVFRGLGVVLIAVGLYLAIHNGRILFSQADSNDFGADPGMGAFMAMAGGAFMVIFGLAALNAGFLGAQARYAAAETAPAVREFGSAFRGDGKFCSECGAGNDRGARFCDACGHAMA